MSKTKKDIVFDAIFLVCTAVCIVAVLISYSPAMANDHKTPHREPTTAATTEETVEPTQEPTQTEPPTTEATQPAVTLYNVPLDADLQLHIIETAEAHGIDPAIIMAMAYRESTYNPAAVGDGGNSYGLLQIQPKWHYKRMQKLGCTDLFDPYQNVSVGIDYLAEMLDRYDGDIEKALVGYNQGSYNGTITRYARTIMAKAEELRSEVA